MGKGNEIIAPHFWLFIRYKQCYNQGKIYFHLIGTIRKIANLFTENVSFQTSTIVICD